MWVDVSDWVKLGVGVVTILGGVGKMFGLLKEWLKLELATKADIRRIEHRIDQMEVRHEIQAKYEKRDARDAETHDRAK